MSSVPLKTLVRKGLDLGFDLGGQIVKSLALSKGGPVGAIIPTGRRRVVVKGVVTAYRTGDIPGTILLLGDEKVMLRVWEVLGIINPAVGDCLEEINGPVRRIIIAAQMDPTESFWVLQTRRLADTFLASTTLEWDTTVNLVRRQAELMASLKFRASIPDIEGLQHIDGLAGMSFGASGTIDFSEDIRLMLYGRVSLGVGEETSYAAFLHMGGGVTLLPPTPSTWYISNEHLVELYVGAGMQAMGGSAGEVDLRAEYTYEDVLYVSNTLTITVHD